MQECRALGLFVDESGNTGPDLMGGMQPFAVTAMVLLDEVQEQAVATAVTKSLTGLHYTPPRELKFSRLSRNSRGRRVLQHVMSSVQASGARVFFSLTEKRYLAASFIVETFLDPLWTDGVPLEMASAVERRKAANLVYQACDDALLRQFSEACTSADRDSIVVAGRCVADRLALHPSEDGPRVAAAVAIGLNVGLLRDGTPPLQKHSPRGSASA